MTSDTTAPAAAEDLTIWDGSAYPEDDMVNLQFQRMLDAGPAHCFGLLHSLAVKASCATVIRVIETCPSETLFDWLGAIDTILAAGFIAKSAAANELAKPIHARLDIELLHPDGPDNPLGKLDWKKRPKLLELIRNSATLTMFMALTSLIDDPHFPNDREVHEAFTVARDGFMEQATLA